MTDAANTAYPSAAHSNQAENSEQLNQRVNQQAKDPNTLEQQEFQPESGAVDQQALQARRRTGEGAERVNQADNTATEEA